MAGVLGFAWVCRGLAGQCPIDASPCPCAHAVTVVLRRRSSLVLESERHFDGGQRILTPVLGIQKTSGFSLSQSTTSPWSVRIIEINASSTHFSSRRRIRL